jgi:hypothetical protein
MAIKTFTTGEVLTASDTNTYLANAGLVYVGAGTLSLTTSATNVTGVFSSTYKNYRVLLNITARSTTSRVDMRYIVGTTPTSSGYYQAGIGSDYASNTVIYFQRSNGDPQFFGYSTAGLGGFTMDIFSPNRTGNTYHAGNYSDVNTGYAFSVGGENVVSNQYTGFQLFTSAGTATVEYQVFGYREG